MYHPIAFIAETYGFNEAELDAFARLNEDRFGIIIEQDKPLLGTWHANDFINAFREMVAMNTDNAYGRIRVR